MVAQEDGGLRVADDPWVRGASDEMPLLAQQTVAEGVEGVDGGVRLAVGHEEVDASLHLIRGALREGQRQDLRRTGPATGDEPGDATGDDLRLAGPRARDDEQRAITVRDGLPLSPVESREERADALDRDRYR